jgi:hypothetical protein
LEWIKLQILWPKLSIMRPYLPTSVFSQLDRAIRKRSPTREQMGKISGLGKSIGLQKNEIIAAVDTPLVQSGITGKSRLSLFIAIIVVTIVAAIGILIMWYFVDPETSPIPTYAPGSFYGSIRPQDFLSQNNTAIIA